MDWQKWIKWVIFAIKLSIFAIKIAHFAIKMNWINPAWPDPLGNGLKWIGRRISWDPARSAKLNEFPLLIREGGSPRRPRRAPRPRELKLFPLFVQKWGAAEGHPRWRQSAGKWIDPCPGKWIVTIFPWNRRKWFKWAIFAIKMGHFCNRNGPFLA